MTISVALAVYNGEKTVRGTIDAVLSQTVVPHEILVLNDGSTDSTLSVLSSYGSKINLLSQANAGIAMSRNRLAAKASGDLIAFLDSDDLWHPEYLQTLQQLFEKYPRAVAAYTGHINFLEDANYRWESSPHWNDGTVELIEPLDFLVRYNRSTGNFGSMSYCTVRRSVLAAMGETPFRVDGVEDSYLASQLALQGPVIYASKPLVAYRIAHGSLSHNHLKSFGRWVQTFELMKPRFEENGDAALLQAFQRASASKRRVYSRMLMGANRKDEAREQLRKSLSDATYPASLAKSLALLSLTYLPSWAHPKWPSGDRNFSAA